jgi:hypothetical protein
MNKTPKPLLLKKPSMLMKKSDKGSGLTMSLEDKEKLVKEKLIATVSHFNKGLRKSSSRKIQFEKAKEDVKYPVINKIVSLFVIHFRH